MVRHDGVEARADRDLVMAAVQQHGYALQYAHPTLKNDFDIVAESTVPFKNVIEEEKPMFLLKKMI